MADFVSALKADLVEQFRGKENIEGLVEVIGIQLQAVYDFYEQLRNERMSIPPWASSLTAWVTLL